MSSEEQASVGPLLVNRYGDDTEEEDSTTNYAMDDYPFSQRLAHFTPGNVYQEKFLSAVQACCIFQAGINVFKGKTKKSTKSPSGSSELDDKFLAEYNKVLYDLKEEYITSTDNEQLQYAANGRKVGKMSGFDIRRRFVLIKASINKYIVPYLPKKVSSMKSGTDLNEVYQQAKVKFYNKITGQEGSPHLDWIFGVPPNKRTDATYFLCARVHRKSTHIDPDPASSDPNIDIVETKAQKLRMKQERIKQEEDSRVMEVKKARQTKVEAMKTTARAKRAQCEIYARKQHIQEQKDNLELLEKYGTDVYSPEELKSKKRACLDALLSTSEPDAKSATDVISAIFVDSSDDEKKHNNKISSNKKNSIGENGII